MVNSGGEDLDVSTSAVNLLLMLDSVLNNQVLLGVRELGELGSVGIETSILRGLDSLVGLSISVELASSQDKVSTSALRGFEVRLNPSVFPFAYEMDRSMMITRHVVRKV